MAGAGCLLNGCPKLGVAQSNVTCEGAVGSDVFDGILMQKSVGEIVGRYDQDDDGRGDEAAKPELQKERIFRGLVNGMSIDIPLLRRPDPSFERWFSPGPAWHACEDKSIQKGSYRLPPNIRDQSQRSPTLEARPVYNERIPY